MAKGQTTRTPVHSASGIKIAKDLLGNTGRNAKTSGVEVVYDREEAGYKLALLWRKADGGLFLGVEIDGGHSFQVDMPIPEGPERGKTALDIVKNHPFAYAANVGHIATEALFARPSMAEAA